MTLKELLDANPDWADLPIVVYREDGTYDYVGGAGSAYRHKETTEDGESIDVVVFAGN